MPISLSEDIHSVTDLKRRTREIVDQLHRTGRPVVLTVNGRADAVLLEVKTYETLLKSANLARLLAPERGGSGGGADSAGPGLLHRVQT